MALLTDVVSGLNPSVKLHTLHGSVVIHHVEDTVSWSNLGCCIPLCGFLVVIQLVRN
jgi:hypothetical protein